jgi:hypothetical protein
MSGTGERYGIIPKDLEEARAENRPPCRDLVRDTAEPAELRDGGADLPVLSGYGARPALAEKVRRFVLWLEERER